MIRLGLLLSLLCASCAASAGPAPAPVEAAAPGMVGIPGPGLTLQARLGLPPGPPVAPAIVALHGCGGPSPNRVGQWLEILTRAGHPVVFPDSFGSRGKGSLCTTPDRGISPGRERRADTVASVQWLLQQRFTPPGGVVVLGWSNGGSTVLAAAQQGVMPAGAVRGFIAFYPGCRVYAQRAEWAPSAPLLILIGADDDWTPAAPCRVLAERFPDRIRLVEYPGAYHEFDAPNRPVRVRHNLTFTAAGTGTAHIGTNEAARADAIQQVAGFLAAVR